MKPSALKKYLGKYVRVEFWDHAAGTGGTAGLHFCRAVGRAIDLEQAEPGGPWVLILATWETGEEFDRDNTEWFGIETGALKLIRVLSEKRK